MKLMKSLAKAVDEYIALRFALGFKLHNAKSLLRNFVAFLKARGSRVITTELALQWAQQPRNATPNTHAKRLSVVRRFALHHRAFDPRTEVPPSDLIPRRKQRKTPHIYSEDEIAALMRESRRLPHPLRSATYTTLIGLLAVTGMRVGEAIALDYQDVDWQRALLTVRATKFGKTREVPIHASTLASLHAYATRRDVRRLRRASPSFFISSAGTRLRRQNVSFEFAHLLQLAGLEHCPRRRPRIHDLRHTFAMRIVCDWYRAGVDVERRLPCLSTYLGHVSPSSTYWYLTATPDLLSIASKRAERAWKVPS
jgi:integrase